MEAPKWAQVKTNTTSYKESFTTYIYEQINAGIIPSTNKQIHPVTEEVRAQMVIKSAIENFRGWNWNPEYQKIFLMVRNHQTDEGIKQTVSFQLYREYMCRIYKNVFEKIYGVSKLESSILFNEIEADLNREYPSLFKDLFGYQTIIAISSIAELIDKILDGELTNAACTISMLFTYPLSVKMSPAVLAVSFHNFKFLQSKERSEDNPAPPKITILSFLGYYSEVDIDIIYEFSENVQLIMIYDASTGGPCLIENPKLRNENTVFEEDSRIPSQKRSFQKISKNILLLPLYSERSHQITSVDLYNLFQRAVLPAIQRFEPEMLIVSHSFNFHPISKPKERDAFRFNLTSNTWSRILFDLCRLVQYKVVVIPHKPANEFQGFNKTDHGIENSHLKKSLQTFIEEYSRPWNVTYFLECFESNLEILSGIRIYKSFFKLKNAGLSVNQRFEKGLSQVFSFYSEHSFYDFLASEEAFQIPLLNNFISKEYFQSISSEVIKNPSISKEFPKSNGPELLQILEKFKPNQVLLFHFQSGIDYEKLPFETLKKHLLEFELYFEDGTPFYPHINTQYIVDYSNNVVYYFNTKYFGEYVHFEFQVNYQQRELFGRMDPYLNQHPLQKSNENLLNVGLCLGNHKIFWVYGELVSETQVVDSNSIYYYDIEAKIWVEPKVKLQKSGKQPIPRHAVTCCYSFLESNRPSKQHLLYVLSGDSAETGADSNKKIYNCIEFYYLDFDKRVFEFTTVDKPILYSKDYVPYYQNFCFNFEDSFMIFGGKHHPGSVYESLESKAFLLTNNNSETTFQKIGVSMKDNRPSNLKDPNEKILFNDESKNIILLNDFTFLVVTEIIPQEYTVLKVKKESGNFSVEINNLASSKSSALFDIKMFLKNKAYVPKMPTTTILALPMEMFSYLRKREPEFTLILFLLVRVFSELNKRDKSLDQSTVLEIIKELLSDPLLKCYKPLGRAVIESSQVLEIITKDIKTMSLLDEIQKAVDYKPSSLSTQETKIKQDLSLAILSNKSKEAIVECFQFEYKSLLTQEILSSASALRADRIFQRNRKLREFHRALFKEIEHRYSKHDALLLLKYSDMTSMNKYVKSEDLGILRDLAGAFAVILFQSSLVKNDESTEESLSIDKTQTFALHQLLIEPYGLLRDDLKDRLETAENEANSLIEDLTLERMPFEKAVKAFLILLLEIAHREEFSPVMTGGETKASTGNQNKLWICFKQSSQPLWDLFVACFRNEFQLEETIGAAIKQGKLKDLGQAKIDPKTEGTRGILRVLDFEDSKEDIYEENESKEKENSRTRKEEKSEVMRNESDVMPNKSEVIQNKSDVMPNKSDVIQNKSDNSINQEKAQKRVLIQKKVNAQEKIKLFVGNNQHMGGPTYIHKAMKRNIDYHSVQNLREVHQSLLYRDNFFFVAPSGSEVYCLHLGRWLRAKIIFYDQKTAHCEPLFLESYQLSSFCIWNSAAYLYIDKIISERYNLSTNSQSENCLVYGSLEEAFEDNGKTKGVLLMTSVLKNSDKLSSRALIADENGVFLIGGAKIASGNRRSPLAFSGKCSFYEINKILKLGTEYVESEIEPMELKRSEVVLAQTKELLFVSNRTNADQKKGPKDMSLKIEIFDKRDFFWRSPVYINSALFTIPLNYRIEAYRQESESTKLLIVAQKQDKTYVGTTFELEWKDWTDIGVNTPSGSENKEFEKINAQEIVFGQQNFYLLVPELKLYDFGKNLLDNIKI